MKNPFKRNNETTTNEFNEPQYMSNGNLYDVYNRLAAQKGLDLSTLPNFKKVDKEIQRQIKNLSNSFINDKSLDDYWLFNLHANYFTNTIVYKCNNFKFNSLIQSVIRYAWINGKSGIYFDKSVNKVYGIIISNIVMNSYGDIEEIQYWPLALNENCKFNEVLDKPLFKITGKDCENVCILKWGTAAISAWIMYWPFVKLQGMLMRMITSQSLAFNKKYIYKIINPNVDLTEMELWYDPLNIFILDVVGGDINNKFKTNEMSGEAPTDFIEFYKQVCGIYYTMFGRRMNLDFKRERNTVEEVSMTSGSIENLERDWYTQFLIFVENIKDINNKLNMIENLQIDEVRLNNWIREERLQGQVDEHDNKIKEDNQGEK